MDIFFCDLHPHSNLRDGPLKIKYRSLIHKFKGQVLYLPKGKGMAKAILQSNVSDSFGKVKAIFQSGKTIPESFNFTPTQPKREIIHSSFLETPIMNDTESKEEFDDDKFDTNIDSECESEDVMSKYMPLNKMKYDDRKPIYLWMKVV